VPKQPEFVGAIMSNYEDLKRSLTTRLQEIENRVGKIEADICSPEDADLNEQAVLDQDDEALAALNQTGLAEIEAIKMSLARIENGTYGVCTNCDLAIPKDRLEALPAAALCIECADNADRLRHRL
jgi:DnaK suppressor protein